MVHQCAWCPSQQQCTHLPHYNVIYNNYTGAECSDWCGGTFLRYNRLEWGGLTNQLLFALHIITVTQELHSVVELLPLSSRSANFKWDSDLKKPLDEVRQAGAVR